MKLLYMFPALLYAGFLLMIGLGVGYEGLTVAAWTYLLLLTTAAHWLSSKRWWGCLPGMAVGSILVWQFNNASAEQAVSMNPLGIAILVYFAAMGIICYKLNKQK